MLHPETRDELLGAADTDPGRASLILPSPRHGQDFGVAEKADSERQAAAAAVVAEAVALAMEAAAAEAAEAVLVTAAAVAEAAGRATDAAESARQARAFAAQAAARSVALEAERTAAMVRERADLAAARVQQAAWLAADELARCIESGAQLDAGHMARLIAATVRAAADATVEDTTWAANAVKSADTAAAAQVASTLAAAEEFVEREVAASADAQRQLATATAAAMALETNAQAAGVALAAKEAAAALFTYEHEGRSVSPNVDPGEHEPTAQAREGRARERSQEVEQILAAARQRDARAEIRDRVADERERATSLRSFLGDQQYEEYEQHAVGLPMRRAAAMDRIEAMTDRTSAAADRATLSAPPAPGAWDTESAAGDRMKEVAAELSHDLRVPLSSIIASVEMLEDELKGHSGQNVAALLERALRAGGRMERMLEQNMTTRAASGSLALLEVDLAEVIRQFLLDSADLLEAVGAVVESDDLPVVRADPDGMYSVLQNLLVNAIKFARPGVPSRVRVSARRAGDRWRISVRDNGVGLPQESGLEVFSLFSRGTSAVTGHGIGLATVARIVGEHGGRVGVVQVQTGAEIWFELP